MSELQEPITYELRAEFDALHAALVNDVDATSRFYANILIMHRKQLWRVAYASFDDYCEVGLKISRQRGYQQIEAAEVMEALPEECKPLIETTAQAAALSKVPEPKRAEVLKTAEAKGPVTAKTITETAKHVAPQLPPPLPRKEKEEKEVHKDATGYRIPDKLVAAFFRGRQINELLTHLGTVRGAIKRVNEAEKKDALFAEVDLGGLLMDINKVVDQLSLAVPYAICADCQGINPENCRSCKGRGFVSKFFWNNCVPTEFKELRKKALE